MTASVAISGTAYAGPELRQATSPNGRPVSTYGAIVGGDTPPACWPTHSTGPLPAKPEAVGPIYAKDTTLRTAIATSNVGVTVVRQNTGSSTAYTWAPPIGYETAVAAVTATTGHHFFYRQSVSGQPVLSSDNVWLTPFTWGAEVPAPFLPHTITQDARAVVATGIYPGGHRRRAGQRYRHRHPLEPVA